jgi:ABC-type transporter Mla subunit MlaD
MQAALNTAQETIASQDAAARENNKDWAARLQRVQDVVVKDMAATQAAHSAELDELNARLTAAANDAKRVLEEVKHNAHVEVRDMRAELELVTARATADIERLEAEYAAKLVAMQVCVRACDCYIGGYLRSIDDAGGPRSGDAQPAGGVERGAHGQPGA